MAWIVALIAVVAAVTAVVRSKNAARDAHVAWARVELAERQAKAADARTGALTDEIRQLAQKRIPAAALALSHPSAPVPGLREAAEVDGGSARLLTEAVQAARAAVIEERQRVDAAARAAMRGTSAKIQSLLNQSQQLLHELQHEYDDPRILQLDFRNELALRRTQSWLTGTPRTVLGALVLRFRVPVGDAYPVCGPSQAGGIPTTWPYECGQRRRGGPEPSRW
nr:hypothetical protein OG781_36210 [Streptomyces sp. NBC_00830]